MQLPLWMSCMIVTMFVFLHLLIEVTHPEMDHIYMLGTGQIGIFQHPSVRVSETR